MHSNHKAKTYNIHIKDKYNESKHTTTEKSLNQQRKRAEKKKRTIGIIVG